MAHVYKDHNTGEYVEAPVKGSSFEKVTHLSDEEAEKLLKNETEDKELKVKTEDKVAQSVKRIFNTAKDKAKPKKKAAPKAEAEEAEAKTETE